MVILCFTGVELCKFAELESADSGIQTQVCPLPNPMFLSPYLFLNLVYHQNLLEFKKKKIPRLFIGD